MENNNKPKVGIKGIIASIILGFVFAASAMGITLDHGYGSIYIDELNAYTAKLLGLSIFEFTRVGADVAVSVNYQNVAIICAIFVVPCFILGRLIHRFIQKYLPESRELPEE